MWHRTKFYVTLICQVFFQVKCDEKKPACSNCSTRALDCDWSSLSRRRAAGVPGEIILSCNALHLILIQKPKRCQYVWITGTYVPIKHMACEPCRNNKTRCVGGRPCPRCHELSIECIYRSSISPRSKRLSMDSGGYQDMEQFDDPLVQLGSND